MSKPPSPPKYFPADFVPQQIHADSPLCAHPLADMFPMMSRDEAKSFREGLIQDGFDSTSPIVLIATPPEFVEECGEWLVLDGRNTLYNCCETGVEPQFRHFDEAKEGSPLNYVKRHNLDRRNLDASARAIVAHDIRPWIIAEHEAKKESEGLKANFKPGTAPAKAEAPDSSSEVGGSANGGFSSRASAAKLAGASDRLTGAAARVERADPELYKRVRVGELALTEAEDIIKKREIAAKNEPERKKAFTDIMSAHGPAGRELIAAIEAESILTDHADLLFFSALPPTTARAIVPLISTGMTAKRAVDVHDGVLTQKSTIGDLMNKALLKGDHTGVWVETVNGFTITIMTPSRPEKPSTKSAPAGPGPAKKSAAPAKKAVKKQAKKATKPSKKK